MIIYCANNLQPSQIVNQLGKYLYRHIDGAYDMKKSANIVDVYFLILYQLKEEFRTESDKDMHEMSINVSITSYADKIRMNLIEVSPNEKTLGFNTFKVDKFKDMNAGYELIMNTVKNRLAKVYEDYDFLF